MVDCSELERSTLGAVNLDMTAFPIIPTAIDRTVRQIRLWIPNIAPDAMPPVNTAVPIDNNTPKNLPSILGITTI